jgi:nucleotide-binding universal stress UspA family protein
LPGEQVVLRSILVALDSTPASSSAQNLAIDLAKRLKCQITGIAVLDRGHITAPTAVGIGGAAFKHHRDQVKLKEAKAFLERMEHRFEATCEAIGAQWQVIEAEGAPHAMIEQEAARHDLLVIGKDTDFHLDEDPSIADSVQHLLYETARPMIICPETAASEGPVLATYDGSRASSRALHMLALLGLVRGRAVHVLSIDDDQAAATERAAFATELLTKHEHRATPHGIRSHADPADLICAEAVTLGATLIAMAASGHRPIRDFFLGSTTQRLLRQCPCPLFVHH